MQQDRPFRLRLMGSFQLVSPDGERIPIMSKKGMALIALVAVARGGERSRVWLQDRLWGTRETKQAQASLRREISNLRTTLASWDGKDLLFGDGHRVGIDIDRIVIDVRELEAGTNCDATDEGEFLEGFDIGEDGFEDWLREQRSRIEDTGRSAARKSRSTEIRLAGPEAEVASSEATSGGLFSGDDPLSGKPTISVLPTLETDDPKNCQLVDGVTDILVERISRLRWLAVIACPHLAYGPASATSERMLTQRHGVEYLLRCRLKSDRGGGPRMIHLTLDDSRTERILWCRSYPLGETLENEGFVRMAEETVAAVAAQIEVEQQKRVFDTSLRHLGSNSLVWRARWHMRRLTKLDAEIARHLLDEAEAENPNDPDVIIEQAYHMAWRIWTMRGDSAQKRALRRTAMRARDLDPFDARGYFLCGIAEFWLGQHDLAKTMLKEAIELNPSMASAYGQLGSCYLLSGEPLSAIPLLRTALRLSPLDMQVFHQFGELALANYVLGRYREALADADRALALRPAYFYAHAIKIASLIALEDREGERTARRAFAAVKPDFDLEAFDWLPFKDPQLAASLKNSLNPSMDRCAG